MTKRRKQLLAVIVPIEVVSAALAWRDMHRRPDDQVRGSKRLWHVLVLINPGNSIAYWMFGRR